MQGLMTFQTAPRHSQTQLPGQIVVVGVVDDVDDVDVVVVVGAHLVTASSQSSRPL
jgi:hypothetical protein